MVDYKAQYKSMNYESLSKEAQRLISKSWFQNFDKLQYIYNEMKLRIK